MPGPIVAVGPDPAPYAIDAVRAAGATVVEIGQAADAMVWLLPAGVPRLRDALASTPGVRWVQLPWAGVEPFAGSGIFDDGRTWTCAKGVYADPVAEHGLALALAGLRHLPERVRARRWGDAKGATLFGADVTIVGGGGIATSLIRLLEPFRSAITVVRRDPTPVPGAARTVGAHELDAALPTALVVFLALALTPETTGIMGARQFGLMRPDAWLVNVARGRHVVTADLVAALDAGAIAGAGLDVTDPEPLPDGHPLWGRTNAIITPHTADWTSIVRHLLARRITANVRRFAAGEPLLGVVDASAGY